MGRNDNQKPNNEKEFNNMGDRVYNKPNGSNRPTSRYNNNSEGNGYRKPNNYQNPVVSEPPKSLADDFVDMIYNVINELQETSGNVRLFHYIDRTKAENGIIAIKVHGDIDTCETISDDTPGIIFYYIDDRSVNNPKNPRIPKIYPGVLLVINQVTGKILFSKFGPRAVEQAEKYVKRILEKEISFVVTKLEYSKSK